MAQLALQYSALNHCATREARPRVIDRHLELPFSNNCANSCCLLTKLLAYCPVGHPSLVQVYNYP